MGYEEALEPKTFVAKEDLSSSQHKIVALTAVRGVMEASGSTQDIIGVLQGEPESGESANIATGGISKVVAGSGGFTAGDWVTADSSGRAVICPTSMPDETAPADMIKILGIAVDTVSSTSSVGSVLIDKALV